MSDPLVPIFAALAHPARLAVFRLLMHRHPHPLSAGQIAQILSLRPSTLSGYLAQLTEAGLIESRRASTTLNYAACPPAAQAVSESWLGTICAGRAWPERRADTAPILNVLFVGRGNAGPTLAAEALLRARHGARFEAFSAGLKPAAQPDAATLALLDAQGLDTAPLWSKSVAEFTGPAAPRVDILVRLEAHEPATPDTLPSAAHYLLWRLAPDTTPVALLDSLAARIAATFDAVTALPPGAPMCALRDVLERANRA